jgi:hypothetical protein
VTVGGKEILRLSFLKLPVIKIAVKVVIEFPPPPQNLHKESLVIVFRD